MKILVSAQGPDISSPVDPRFGRAPSLVLVDSRTGEWSAYVNPGTAMGHGAGIEAGRLASEIGAEVVLTGAAGPNAFRTLEAAGIAVYAVEGGTVASAVDRYKQGTLRSVVEATGPAHAGLGRAGGMDGSSGSAGSGFGGADGAGGGRGCGGGRGLGRGTGRGRGAV